MLKFRLIARLDVRNDNLIKTVRCEGVRRIGDPAEAAVAYDLQGVDEIVFLDVVASLYGRNSLADIVADVAKEIFTPMTVAGGVTSVEEARRLFAHGADKVAVNTAAVANPNLLTELSEKFGAQAVTLQLDAKRRGDRYEAYIRGAREPTGKDAVAWAVEAERRGVGEILATSIDREGMARGCDLELAARLVEAVGVPVVIAGGVGGIPCILDAHGAGVSGVAMAGVLHYSALTLDEIRRACLEEDIPVRKAGQG